MAKQPTQRAEIPEKERWDLEKIYTDTTAWEKDFDAAKEKLSKIAAFNGHLTENADTLYRYLQLSEALELNLEDLFVYAKMKLDEDNRVNTYQGMRDRAMALSVKASEETAFFTPEILAAGEEKIRTLIDSDERLALYERFFKDLLRYAPHTLSPKEESLLAMAGEMAEGTQNAFSMLNEADLRFPSVCDDDGEEITINHANFIRLMESKNRRVREEAFTGLYSTYRTFRNTFAATLAGNVKGECFFAKARNYPSALNSALFADAVDETLYNNMIKAVRDNLDAFRQYLRLRKKVLKLEDLHFYDVYTPLVAEAERKIPYEEGFETVKKALAPLGEEYISLLQKAKDERWIDVRENEGKTSGAYSWGVFNTVPYVLMSYQDNLNSVFTMAHELGHSLHSYYSWHNQPYPYAYYRIFVAEVASTVKKKKPFFSISIWKNFAALSSARPCSPNLKRSFTNAPKPWKRSPPTISAIFISISTKTISAKKSSMMRESAWNGHASPISTTAFTFINTRPVFPPLSIWQTKSFPARKAPLNPTFPSLKAAAAMIPMNC